MTFEALATELKDLCKAPCVLRYEKAELVSVNFLSVFEDRSVESLPSVVLSLI